MSKEQAEPEISGEREYEKLMKSYALIAKALEHELEQIISGNVEINEAALESIVTKRSALGSAEKKMAFYITTKIKASAHQNQKQSMQLAVQKDKLLKLKKERSEKEQVFKEKAEELDKSDIAGQFFLPGDSLEVYKEAQASEIKDLQEEVKELDKVIEKGVSGLPIEERSKLEVESVRILEAYKLPDTPNLPSKPSLPDKPNLMEKPNAVKRENIREHKLVISNERKLVARKKGKSVNATIAKVVKHVGRAIEYVGSKIVPLKPHKTPIKEQEAAKAMESNNSTSSARVMDIRNRREE